MTSFTSVIDCERVMSEMTTTNASDDTLIQDSQLTGFTSFKQSFTSCCCRLFRKSSSYDLSKMSKQIEQQDKPSFINQGFQADKQATKDKLDKIAKTLPNSSVNNQKRTTVLPPKPTNNNNPKKQETSTGFIFISLCYLSFEFLFYL